jgi:hypothetical protein
MRAEPFRRFSVVRSVPRGCLALAAILAFPVCLYAIILAASSLSKGYSWPQMDWDNDGHTSLAEFLEAGDTGETPVTIDGKQCREVYWYKDGIPVKTICP